MKYILSSILSGMIIIGFASQPMAAREKKPAVQTMSEEELIKAAQSAAPEEISKEATIMIPGPDGKLKEVKKGTNNFTCVPDISGQEKPDPFCGDEAAFTWLRDMMEGKEKPTNTEPGIAYMAKGGYHWEKDGKVTMNMDDPAAKRVKEPPHWMVFWPYEKQDTQLPTMPGDFGAYIMYEGTPYAHLMVYQDPNKIKG